MERQTITEPRDTDKKLLGFAADVHFRAPGDFMPRVHMAARTRGMTASNFMRAAICDALRRVGA